MLGGTRRWGTCERRSVDIEMSLEFDSNSKDMDLAEWNLINSSPGWRNRMQFQNPGKG